jgi:hypothetical protein
LLFTLALLLPESDKPFGKLCLYVDAIASFLEIFQFDDA